jgi:hypothetical protein
MVLVLIIVVHQDEVRGPGDGFVTFTYPNGDTYTGDMQAGKRQGRGTYIEHSTGNTYEGDWKADVRHGKGQCRPVPTTLPGGVAWR